MTRPLRMSTANKLVVWSETNTSLERSRIKKGQMIVVSRVLFVEPFLDSPDPAIATRGDDLLPLSHRLPRYACVIAADIAALRTCEELLGCCRDVGEARIVHGLSQAQRVIRNLRPIQEASTYGVR